MPAAVIAEGEKLFRNGEYEKALVRYNAVLSEDAGNISSLGLDIMLQMMTNHYLHCKYDSSFVSGTIQMLYPFGKAGIGS